MVQFGRRTPRAHFVRCWMVARVAMERIPGHLSTIDKTEFSEPLVRVTQELSSRFISTPSLSILQTSCITPNPNQPPCYRPTPFHTVATSK
jgi:hypothetical protein